MDVLNRRLGLGCLNPSRDFLKHVKDVSCVVFAVILVQTMYEVPSKHFKFSASFHHTPNTLTLHTRQWHLWVAQPSTYLIFNTVLPFASNVFMRFNSHNWIMQLHWFVCFSAGIASQPVNGPVSQPINHVSWLLDINAPLSGIKVISRRNTAHHISSKCLIIAQDLTSLYRWRRLKANEVELHWKAGREQHRIFRCRRLSRFDPPVRR